MRMACAVAAGVLAVAGCGTTTGSGEMSPPTGAAAAAVPFALPTHCGIDELLFQGRYYEAVNPLSDGNGNPPPGWDNPAHSGVLRVVSPAEVEFRDAEGHVVLFRLRPQATSAKNVCL